MSWTSTLPGPMYATPLLPAMTSRPSSLLPCDERDPVPGAERATSSSRCCGSWSPGGPRYTLDPVTQEHKRVAPDISGGLGTVDSAASRGPQAVEGEADDVPAEVGCRDVAALGVVPLHEGVDHPEHQPGDD